jgi:rubrerythrin
VKSEELLRLLEDLRADEEDHLVCLLSLLYRTGADRLVMATGQPAWVRPVGRVTFSGRPMPPN